MQTRVIRQGAQNAVFDYMSVSADEQKIAIARTDQSLSDSTGTNGLLNCAYNIYIMNRDGSDLRRVAFPE
jgi:Tol biopolymer transport system component